MFSQRTSQVSFTHLVCCWIPGSQLGWLNQFGDFFTDLFSELVNFVFVDMVWKVSYSWMVQDGRTGN